MSLIVVDEMSVDIPVWVKDWKSFRRWIYADDFPEDGRICFLNGKVWIDMSREQVFTHSLVRTVYTGVLQPLVQGGRMGKYFSDGVLLSNVAAALTAIPDGLFISEESWEAAKIQMIEASQEGCIELEGTPDMTLEIVSKSSVKKDKEWLVDLYWQAGIQEYWLVDVRGERLEYTIYRHTPEGYIAAPKRGGWIKSNVFGKSFRLTRSLDKRGNPEFTLDVR